MRVRLRQIILTRILWIERTEVVFYGKAVGFRSDARI